MKTYNIVNLLVNDDSTFEYKFPIVDKEGNEVDIFTSTQFFTKICQKYTSFSVLCPRYYDDDAHQMVDMISDRSEAISYLQAIFTLWYDDRVAGVEKLYNTFRDNYNPLWNVDGVEGHIEETNQDEELDTEETIADEKVNYFEMADSESCQLFLFISMLDKHRIHQE